MACGSLMMQSVSEAWVDSSDPQRCCWYMLQGLSNMLQLVL